MGNVCDSPAGERSEEEPAAALTLTPIREHFGVVAEGVDLSEASDAQLRALRAAVYAHGFVLVRGQAHITLDDELRLARAFPHQDDPPGVSYTGGASKQAKLPAPYSDIAVIGSFDLADYHGLTASSRGVYPDWPEGQRAWHCDGLADTVPPPDLTTMRCVRTPSAGGETLFACSRRAAELLPRDLPHAPERVLLRYSLPARSALDPSGRVVASREGRKGDTAEGGDDVNVAAGTLVPLVAREPHSGARALCATYHVEGGYALGADGRAARALSFEEARDYLDAGGGRG